MSQHSNLLTTIPVILRVLQLIRQEPQHPTRILLRQIEVVKPVVPVPEVRVKSDDP